MNDETMLCIEMVLVGFAWGSLTILLLLQYYGS
jgi:hypothetical protein